MNCEIVPPSDLYVAKIEEFLSNDFGTDSQLIIFVEVLEKVN